MGNTTNQDNSHLAAKYKAEADKAMQAAQHAHDQRMKELENQNKEKRRKVIEAGIIDVGSKIEEIDQKVKEAKTKQTKEKAKYVEAKAEKDRLNGKIKDFPVEKKEALEHKSTKIGLDDARKSYFSDRNEIDNALEKTGVHSDDVCKFLKLTHSMTAATMGTQAEANKLDVALSTFGIIINNECQDKYTIESYFNDESLEHMIPILANHGFKTLDDLVCKNEKEFEKDILLKIEKGIARSEKSEKEDALKTKTQFTERKGKDETRLTEIENELKDIENKLITKEEKEKEKTQLIGEKDLINSNLKKIEKGIKKQKEILQKLEDKAKTRDEKKLEEKTDEKTDAVDDGSWLDTNKKGEELCVFLLTEWGLKEYWETLKDDGWDDADDWAELEDKDLKDDFKIKKGGYRKRFIKNAKKWKDKAEESEKQKQINKNESKPLVCYNVDRIERRKLENICLRSEETWGVLAKEKAQLIKDDLLQLCPVMGTFFGRISQGVKQAEQYLEYKSGDQLNDSQLQAIKMVDENKTKMKAIELKRKDAKEKPKVETQNDEKDDEKQPELVVQSKALVVASVISVNVIDSLSQEFAVSKTTERGLTMAISVEDCCKNIIKNQASLRQSVFLAQAILNFKPANMSSDKVKQLWKAVDAGIVRIFSSAVDMVRVAAEYFSFFLRFQNSFKFFVSCYDGKDTSLRLSLERLKKDIREFNKFQENFSDTVIELNKTAMECIGNCVKQSIGHEQWEKRQEAIKKSEKIWLDKQTEYFREEQRLNRKKDLYEKQKVTQKTKEAKAKQEYDTLTANIKTGDDYLSSLRKQLVELRTTLANV